MNPLRKNAHFDPLKLSWAMDKDTLGFMLADIATATEVTFDLETTGLDEHAVTGGLSNGGVAARVVCASFTVPQDGEHAWEPRTWVVPLSHPDSPFRGQWRKVLRLCAQELRRKHLIGANVKFDCRWIYAHTGIDLSGWVDWDTQISSHLLDENSRTALKERVPTIFDVTRWDDHDLTYPGAAEDVPLFDLGTYAARDTYWTQMLSIHHRDLMYQLPDADYDPPSDPDEQELAALGDLARTVAMSTVRGLTRIEEAGIGLDIEWAERELAEREEAAHALYIDLRDYVPPEVAEEVPELEIDLSSFAPTSKYFRAWAEYAVQQGDLRVIEQTPRGAPRWNKDVLHTLAMEESPDGAQLATRLLDYRDAAKKAEFLHSWIEKVTPAGLIHTTYNAGKVVTGRLCISPDSLIEMPRDMTKHPDGVPMREVKVGDWVYSFDHHMELTLRQVEWIGPTKTDQTVIVTVENSEGERRELQCTPDHLVRLYNGSWRHAEYLLHRCEAPRVLSMVRRGWKERSGNDRYLQFFPHSNSRHAPPSVVSGVRYGSTSGGITEHRWVMEQVIGRKLSTKWDVNHRDGNKVNNHPDNLEYLPAAEHRSNTHRDGTWGKQQPWTDTYIGPNDFRVVSVEPGPTIEVWDMTIPEDHQFIANGIVVHNSSNGPNMQQVTSKLKPAFKPRPGYYIADLDYSQIELRVAAFVSRCQPMIDAFQRGDDLHRLLGARLTGKAPPDVQPTERQAAKSANFGLLYGMSPGGFQRYASSAYGVTFTIEEAEAVHEAFYAMWEGIGAWHARCIQHARRYGQITSPIGRVRRLPDIYSVNTQFRGDAERQAINSPVQGFASDLMQTAAASILGVLPGHEAIPGVRLVGTVHDSIVAEVPISDWKDVTRACQERMVTIDEVFRKRLHCDIDVPLAAEATVGTRWGLSDIGVLE